MAAVPHRVGKMARTSKPDFSIDTSLGIFWVFSAHVIMLEMQIVYSASI